MKQPANKELTTRQLEILQLMSIGESVIEIGKKVGLSPRSIESHVGKIKVKLDCNNSHHAMAEAFRRNIIK